MSEIDYIFGGTPEQFGSIAESYAARQNIPFELIREGGATFLSNRLARTGTGIVLKDEIAIRGILRANGRTTRLAISFNPNSTTPQSEMETFLQTFLDRLHRDGWEIITLDYSIPASEPQPAAIGATAELTLPSPIETDNELREAIYKIKAEPGKPEWWIEVSALFFRRKRANPKYNYRQINELLGHSDEKNTGQQIRKHSRQNHPKPPKTT